MITVYGIPNCDTVKKARTWLETNGVAHEFHDFKKAGVPEARLPAWQQAVGDALLNRKGTTWRKLDAAVQAEAETPAGARAVMAANASVIKRPVVEWADGDVTVGFDAAQWAGRLA
ncbi:MAG: arsenate reductase [Comamonadaceae bacterium]|nr:MAG: arsenate reductase [Comamonadaceae bacterium]